MNAGFEQAARDLAVCFRWDRKTGGVNAADELAPVCGPISFPLAADGTCCLFVQIADGDELRNTFRCEICVDARVLPPETADSDDCCA